MGRFVYENNTRIEFEDRLLSHLQVVIGNKLRRDEPFYFTWKDANASGSSRTTVWVHPRASLVFQFYGSRDPAMNRAWLDALMATANSPLGLRVVPEPHPESQAPLVG